jgi:exonuclease VII large subunit
MSTPANVQSLEAIDAVRNAMALFAAHVGDALTELDAEMRRLKEWLEHDRPRHWRSQVRVATDQVHDAQQALHRCLMFPIGTERPSCYEERDALKKAQARLAYCQAKEERVRHWQKTIQHELSEYDGRISQLVRLVEIDAPQSIGILQKITRHLEDYQSVRTVDSRVSYDELKRQIWPEDETAPVEENVQSNATDNAAADESPKAATE